MLLLSFLKTGASVDSEAVGEEMKTLAKEESELSQRRNRAAERLRNRGQKVDEDSIADEMLREDGNTKAASGEYDEIPDEAGASGASLLEEDEGGIHMRR